MRDDEEFLIDIAKGLQPRCFTNTGVDKIIYEEDQEVAEMYFIVEGEVGIAINSYGDINKSYEIGYRQEGSQLICDYYVIAKSKANFMYVCTIDIDAYALTKKYLHETLFQNKNYLDYKKHIEFESYKTYSACIYSPLIKFRKYYYESKN